MVNIPLVMKEPTGAAFIDNLYDDPPIPDNAV